MAYIVFSVDSFSQSTSSHYPFDDTFNLDPRDEWSLLSDAKERRRRQNRLNQRAYRRRRQVLNRGKNDSRNPNWPDAVEAQPAIVSHLTSPLTPALTKQSTRRLCTEEALNFLQNFSNSAYQSYISGAPTADHLLTLSKVNVFRAFVHNLSILGITAARGCMPDDAISQFSINSPNKIDHTKLPLGLRPTQVQRDIPHHPWLDFFPFANMRDNLIRAGDFNDDQLCADIMGFWDFSNESCGLLVWGEPSDPKNWEVSEAFVKKWPWVVRGLPELMESTNYWRRKRGEKMIFRYL